MDFFSHKRFGKQNEQVRDMTACAIDTRDMLRQMALPLIAERRVKGALSFVARETGLPFSKLRRLYYGITNHVLHIEWNAIEAAHARWLVKQEQKLENELATLRALQDARRQGRLGLDNPTNDSCAVQARTNPTADNA